MKFKRDDRALSAAVHAFLVIAAAILAVLFFMNLPRFWGAFSELIRSLRSVIIGFSIAYICAPIVRFAENMILPRLTKRNRRLARVLAIAITTVFVLLIITVLVFMIVPQIATNFDAISHRVSVYLEAIIKDVDAWIEGTGLFPQFEGLASLLELESVSATLTGFLSNIAVLLSALGLQLVEATVNLLIGAFLAVHILYHKELLAASVKRLTLSLCSFRVYRWLSDLVHYADRTFGQFIVGKLFDSLIVGLLSFILFALIGVPYYPLVSAVICIASIIPAFGYIIGAIPCLIIVWFENPSMTIWFLLALLLIQQLDGNIIGPKIVGAATGLPSFFIITAIILAGAYFGPIGWFIGVPLFAVIGHILTDLLDRALIKKDLPTEGEHYENTRLREIYVDTLVPQSEGKEEQDEEVV